MTNETLPEKSPNDTLADLVVAKLRQGGFVSHEKVGEITAKLRAGTVSSEDWKLWIDLATSGKVEDGDNGKD